MIYRPLLSITGVFACLLGVLLIVAPEPYLSLYLPQLAPGDGFAAQRLAPAVIGLGAILWAARDLPAGRFAATLCWIAAAVWAGVAATGVFHYVSGVASGTILIAALSEVVLALLFGIAARQVRNA